MIDCFTHAVGLLRQNTDTRDLLPFTKTIVQYMSAQNGFLYFNYWWAQFKQIWVISNTLELRIDQGRTPHTFWSTVGHWPGAVWYTGFITNPFFKEGTLICLGVLDLINCSTKECPFCWHQRAQIKIIYSLQQSKSFNRSKLYLVILNWSRLFIKVIGTYF